MLSLATNALTAAPPRWRPPAILERPSRRCGNRKETLLMVMRLLPPAVVLLVAAWARPIEAQHAPAQGIVRVDNSLALVRRDETVAVPWAELQRRLAGVSGDQSPRARRGTPRDSVAGRRRRRRRHARRAHLPGRFRREGNAALHDRSGGAVAEVRAEGRGAPRRAARRHGVGERSRRIPDLRRGTQEDAAGDVEQRHRRLEQEDARADRGEVVHEEGVLPHRHGRRCRLL